MNSVSSRKHIFGFYFSIIFVCLFFTGMGVIMIVISSNTTSDKSPFILYVLSLLCFIVAVYSVIRYNKNAPDIFVDSLGIKLNSTMYSWDSIQEITLTGKQPFKYIITHNMEGICLKFKDGSIKYLYDDLYINWWQVKSFIKETVIDKNYYYETAIVKIKNEDIDNGQFDFFKGHAVFSFRGIVLWGGVILFATMFMLAGKINFASVIVISIACISWFMFQSLFMDYFALSSNYLLIKNHSFFWKNNVFSLEDIKEITFETRDKMPNCLRVVTKDFRTKIYRAGTLTDKKWLELKKGFEQRGIIVRNELTL